MANSVRLWREPVVLPTFEPDPPQPWPMFLEKRVYQGSSGRVYPLPVTDRIAETSTPRAWDAVHLENEYLRVMVLPEIGGRIHVLQDKSNGYDLVYRQEVIKPALVGLAGPWISGGIEFNWPQHHRPSTFRPAQVDLEEHADGSKTIWLGEHDALQRMKGMHGVCLHPGRAVLELKARVYNRTRFTQTFLWWANVATRVHEDYQSFFPPDVHYVADHAKRSMSAFPLCAGRYYGVDYAGRARHGVPPREQPRQFVPRTAAPNDLSWYANIPVPTSYMAMGSRADFFGGYDFHRGAGLVHVANHHIAPGKKQWTWGNHEFGYAWDRNLTAPDANGEYAPYIELMAGVYTDNQPDFSFLQPGETKNWSQFWYPIRDIGPPQQANADAAIHIDVARREATIGVAVTRPRPGAKVRLTGGGRTLLEIAVDVAPDRPYVGQVTLPPRLGVAEIRAALIDADGAELVSYQAKPPEKKPVPLPAVEPPRPAAVASLDELFLIGLHLEQYRHATRLPEDYWREGLRRDPGDWRCHHALGRWHLQRGEFADAERHVRRALARLTARNPNPYDGEPSYTLGLILRYLDRDEEAYAAFYKATWNQAWQSAGFHALAEIDSTRGERSVALEHLERALRTNVDNLRARNLQVVMLRRHGRGAEAEAVLDDTLRLDPLDQWARHLRSEPLACDTQTRLDLAHDMIRAGLYEDAVLVLDAADPEPFSGTAPLVAYTAAWICHRQAHHVAARRWLRKASAARPGYCFPARLEELQILSWAVATDPTDAAARSYLGNLLYDRRRHREAITQWERSLRQNPANAVAWRNLGLSYYNVTREPARARRAYDRALGFAPRDARLLYERDQLWKRLGVSPAERLCELETRQEIVARRDDLTIEFGTLLLMTGHAERALELVTQRRFQPWEGGEGQARGLYVAAHLALGRRALARGDSGEARRHFLAALESPENLGEARHLLANAADIYFWLGCAHSAAGDRAQARLAWRTAATFAGDFRDMRMAAFSEQTYFSALAWQRLGQKAKARRLLLRLLKFARERRESSATIDYFATSLPNMILFEADLPAWQRVTARFLEALALRGLGRETPARQALRVVARDDPGNPLVYPHLSP